MNNYQIHDKDRRDYAQALLRGHAMRWWVTQVSRKTEPRDWQELQQRLTKQFGILDQSETAREKLHKLVQTTSVINYITAFNDQYYQITNMGEEEAFNQFKIGLKQEIKKEMQRRRIKQGLTLLMQEAQRYDELLYPPRTKDDRPRRSDTGKPKFASKGKFIPRRSFNLVEQKGKDTTCYNCGKKGHFAKECRSKPNKRPPPKKPQGTFGNKSSQGSFGGNKRPVRQINMIRTERLQDQDAKPRYVWKVKPMDDGTIPVGKLRRIQLDWTEKIPTGQFAGFIFTQQAQEVGLVTLGNIFEASQQPPYSITVINQGETPISYSKDGNPIGVIRLFKNEWVDDKKSQPEEQPDETVPSIRMITPKLNTLNVQIEINGKVFPGLIDCGADGTYIPPKMLKEIGLSPRKLEQPFIVRMASGEEYSVEEALQDIDFLIQGAPFKMDFYVTSFSNSQIILGGDWLQKYNPQINWVQRLIRVTINRQRHNIQAGTKHITDIDTSGIARIEFDDSVYLVQSITNEETQEDLDPRVAAILENYKDVFSDELPIETPLPRETYHIIPLVEGAKPIQSRQYKMSDEQIKILTKTIQDLKRQNIIEPSTSPWRTPVILVKKKTGDWRMVLDYRKVNNLTKGDGYPMKDVIDLLNQIAKGKIFTTLDLTQGYHQIPMDPDSKEITAFSVPGEEGGLYHYNVMPFGLKNAPASFQRFADEVYKGLPCTVYIDDVAIYSDNLEQHLADLEAVLQRMREQKVYAKRKKCIFAQPKVPYLGHFVSHGKVEVDPKKTQAIRDWPRVTNLKQLRGFLGLTGYYRRFIENYAKVAIPLTTLLKKETIFKWGAPQEEAKQALINALTTAPVLAAYDSSKPIVVCTDASDHAIGAVLSQEGRPVVYLSKTLSETEKKWSIYEKELFAVVYAFKQWDHYLALKKFDLITDNGALSYIQKQPKISPKQARWLDVLSQMDFTLTHKPGKENTVADALSRRDIFGISYIDSSTWQEKLRALTQKIEKPTWAEEKDGFYWKKDQIYVPTDKQLRTTLIQDAHIEVQHLGFKKTLANLSRTFYWEKQAPQVRRFVETCDTCQRTKAITQKQYGLLTPIEPPNDKFETASMDLIGPLPITNNQKNAILVMVDMFSKMVILEAITMEHTAEDIAEVFFRSWIKRHGTPRKIISDRDPRFTSRFWRRLFELAGTKIGLSTAYHPQADGQTERANRTLESILAGQVNAWQNDWDKYLPMAEFAMNSAYHSSIKMAPFQVLYGKIPLMPMEHLVPERKVPHAEDFLMKMTNVIKEVRHNLIKAKQAQKKYADKHRRSHTFKEGDQVLLSTKNLNLPDQQKGKLGARWAGPYQITEEIGENTFRLNLGEGVRMHDVFHTDKFKPYHTQRNQEFPGRVQSPPPPLIIQGEEHYLVEGIIGKRCRKGVTQYLVRWKGYGAENDTWEPEINVQHLTQELRKFNQMKRSQVQMILRSERRSPPSESFLSASFHQQSPALHHSLSSLNLLSTQTPSSTPNTPYPRTSSFMEMGNFQAKLSYQGTPFLPETPQHWQVRSSSPNLGSALDHEVQDEMASAGEFYQIPMRVRQRNVIAHAMADGVMKCTRRHHPREYGRHL